MALGVLATLIVIAVPGLKFAYRSDETHVAIETAAFLIPGARGGSVRRTRAARALAHRRAPLRRAGSAVAHQPLLLGHPGARRREPGQVRDLGARRPAVSSGRPHSRSPPARAAAPYRAAPLAYPSARRGRRRGRTRRDPRLALRRRPAARASTPRCHRTRRAGRGSSGTGSCSRSRSRPCSCTRSPRSASSDASERERDALLLWVALSAALSALARLELLPVPVAVLGVGLRRRRVQARRLLRAADRNQPRDARLPARSGGRRRVRGAPTARARAARRARAGARVHPQRGGAAQRHDGPRRHADGDRRRARARRSAHGDLVVDDAGRRAARGHARDGRRRRWRCAWARRVEVDCTGDPELATAARQSLERIVREATSNAVRHGQANVVRIEISADDRLRVAIVDDGRGLRRRTRRRPRQLRPDQHARARGGHGRRRCTVQSAARRGDDRRGDPAERHTRARAGSAELTCSTSARSRSSCWLVIALIVLGPQRLPEMARSRRARDARVQGGAVVGPPRRRGRRRRATRTTASAATRTTPSRACRRPRAPRASLYTRPRRGTSIRRRGRP